MIAAAAGVVVGNLALGLAGCQGPQREMNSVQRAAWDRRKSEARTEWDRAEQALWTTEERTRQLKRQLARMRPEMEKARAVEREQADELMRVLQRLEAMEQDLVAAAARQREIEAELAGVRDLEQQLVEREGKLAELQTKGSALDGRLAAEQAALVEKQRVVNALLAAVANVVSALDLSEKTLEQALQAAWDAASARLPAEPAAEKVEETEKKQPEKPAPKKDG